MIDLHTHSSASDGSDSPEELVRKAHALGLRALALTDHDTLDGLDAAEETARSLSLDFVRGCEISTKGPLGDFHVLGLWIPRQCEGLRAFLAAAKKRRAERNRKILEKARALGLGISQEDFGGKPLESLGRPHFARALMEKGYVRSINEGFAKYLGKGGAIYFPKEAVTPEEAAAELSRAGAKVFIAHPFLNKSLGWAELERAARVLKNFGLNGLEAWHSGHNRAEIRSAAEIAKRNGLQISGGSDYHGSIKPNIQLGYAGHGLPCPDEIYYNLLEYYKKDSGNY